MEWNGYHKNSSPKCLILFACFSVFIPSLGQAATSFWQGPYVGAYLGGGFGNQHVSTQSGSVANSSYFISSTDINAVNSAAAANKHSQSWIAGAQLGHDWVAKQLTYGVAVDYSLLPLNSSNTISKAYPSSQTTYSVYTSMKADWLLTLRARLGYQTRVKTWPSLLYLTGGMAITQLKVINNYSDNSSLFGAGGNSNSQNSIGWALGAGLEIASCGRATLNLEYLYTHFPPERATSTVSNSVAGFGVPVQSLRSPFISRGNFNASLIKLGLNYRFDE